MCIFVESIKHILTDIGWYYRGVIWASHRLKSPETRSFVQEFFFQANNKKNTKTPHYWLYVTGFIWMTHGLTSQTASKSKSILVMAYSCHFELLNEDGLTILI